MIKVDIEFETEYGIFRDALYLPKDHNLSEAEINALKQERVDNWLIVAKPQNEEVNG